jgi:hypothetical protein
LLKRGPRKPAEGQSSRTHQTSPPVRGDDEEELDLIWSFQHARLEEKNKETMVVFMDASTWR